MKQNKYLTDLFLESKDRFGFEDAVWLFSSYLPKGLPKRAYHTYEAVHSFLKRELDGFYHLREENRRSREVEAMLNKRYGRWKV